MRAYKAFHLSPPKLNMETIEYSYMCECLIHLTKIIITGNTEELKRSETGVQQVKNKKSFSLTGKDSIRQNHVF